MGHNHSFHLNVPHKATGNINRGEIMMTMKRSNERILHQDMENSSIDIMTKTHQNMKHIFL